MEDNDRQSINGDSRHKQMITSLLDGKTKRSFGLILRIDPTQDESHQGLFMPDCARTQDTKHAKTALTNLGCQSHP
jgi:hypothetical protein